MYFPTPNNSYPVNLCWQVARSNQLICNKILMKCLLTFIFKTTYDESSGKWVSSSPHPPFLSAAHRREPSSVTQTAYWVWNLNSILVNKDIKYNRVYLQRLAFASSGKCHIGWYLNLVGFTFIFGAHDTVNT